MLCHAVWLWAFDELNKLTMKSRYCRISLDSLEPEQVMRNSTDRSRSAAHTHWVLDQKQPTHVARWAVTIHIVWDEARGV